MIKISLMLFVFLFSVSLVLAEEINWTPQFLDNDAAGVKDIHAEDINGDRRIDILAPYSYEGLFTWFKNMGGSPPQFEKRYIDEESVTFWSVYTGDLDDDHDVDIICGLGEGDVRWYENDGGNPINWGEHVIGIPGGFIKSVYAIDIDSDEDLDVLAASSSSGANIVLYENNGKVPLGWEEHVIASGPDSARDVYSIDIDGDQDMDVLGAFKVGSSDGKVVLYENEGGDPIRWEEHIVDDNLTGMSSVFAIDLDKDGDNDILATSKIGGEDELIWYENLGGNPIIWTKHLVDVNYNSFTSVYAADLDKDQDLDILTTSEINHRAAWYENIGHNTLDWEEHIITTEANGAQDIYPADFDKDNDLDVVVGILADRSTSDLYWYESNLDPPGGNGNSPVMAKQLFEQAHLDGEGQYSPNIFQSIWNFLKSIFIS